MKVTRLAALASVVSFVGLVGLASGVACEVIVPSDVATPLCTMTEYTDPGNGTCPSGMYCEGAGCKGCQAKDICDGYDNDCDGIIDDGPYSDHDSDGYTYCGKGFNSATGTPLDADCNDDNPKIYPGAHEICNGKDDNCDGIIDNPSGPYDVCPPDFTCVPQTGQCVPNGGMTPDGGLLVCTPCSVSQTPGCCESPNVCDPGTLACVPPGTQDAGTSCSGNLACTTGICSDPAELGPGQTGGTCTQPCCTSADCDAASVCWGAGTGGNYCIPASAAGRHIGTGLPGATCGTATDCRSGVCTSNTCEDTCCSNSDCARGTTCAATTLGSNITLACVTAGSGAPNTRCTQDSECASNYCANYCANTSCSDVVSLCAQPCCSSKQCGSFEGNQFVCEDDFFPPVGASSPVPTSGPVVPVCDAVQQQTITGQAPTGKVGAPCTGITNCFSNICILTGSSGYCSDVCCKDADCATTGYVCRPTQQSNGTYLRCVPNPSSE